MKKIVFIFIVVSFFLLIILASFPELLVRYDNVSPSDNLITVTYPPEDINSLKLRSNNSQYTYWNLLMEYDVECVRKTHQGFYVVFLQTNDEYAYVFIDKKLLVYDILIYGSFFSYHDFELIDKEDTVMSMSDVLSMDTNAISIPISMYFQTAHIVQEGIVCVTYSPVKDGVVLSGPVAINVEFRSDEYVMRHQDELIAQCVPFVLAVDKLED